jgi:Ni2+-binding GTPase involved in maturation of urease and hydrogenase
MPIARLARTLLVIGAPGSGKTVTLGRLAYGVATTTDWQVIVVDAKGDPDTQAAFAASMPWYAVRCDECRDTGWILASEWQEWRSRTQPE